MFDRLTDDARQIVVGAQDAARELGSGSIGTGELLVALLDHAVEDAWSAEPLAALEREPAELAARVRLALSGEDGLDASALAFLGIDLSQVRRRVDSVFGKGALGSARRRNRGSHVPFTPGAKQALEAALQEAARTRSKSVDGRHLMLGVLDSKDGTARALLTQAIGVADQPDETARRVAALREALTRAESAG